jgi:hypothetical protein
VADNRQFGSPRVARFGDQPTGSQPGDCVQCEAMLADALDATLSPADLALFDAHVAHCASCAQMLADARRGAAWLELLRAPRPEPPAELLERILAQTTGAQTTGAQTSGVHISGVRGSSAAEVSGVPIPIFGAPALAPGYSAPGYGPAAAAKVLPFRSRFSSAVHTSSFGQIVLQPRLAMTAAMAFFSIALTLDLTGVRLQSLRANDLRPGSLKRDFYSANARVVQYYEGLRVVYELESRVHDLQSASDNDASAPASAPAPGSGQPAAAQPGAADRKAAPASNGSQPNGSQPERKKAAPNPGSSRREDLTRSQRLVAEDHSGARSGAGFHSTLTATAERAQA